MKTKQGKCWMACLLVVLAVAGASASKAAETGETAEAVVVSGEQKLDRNTPGEVLTVVGADGHAAVVWTREFTLQLQGRSWAGPAAPAVTLGLTGATDRLLRSEVAFDGGVRVAYRGAANAPFVETYNSAGARLGAPLVLAGEGDQLDFLPEGRFVTATAVPEAGGEGAHVALLTHHANGDVLAQQSFDFEGRLDALLLSAHGDESLLGLSHSEACGGRQRQTRSVVTRWNLEAELVRNPRRFPAARCGNPAKLLRFLDGPTAVGSVAVLQDRTARRFIAGDPPPSELEFSFPIAGGEEMLAFGSDEAVGRFVVVTRSTAAARPVHLFAQLFGRDGKARSGRVELGAPGTTGSEPIASVALAADGTAWIAYSRLDGAASRAQGLYLRRIGFRVP